MTSQFVDLLQESTEKVGGQYFHLPVSGLKAHSYRERVYCYEVYHQLQLLIRDEQRFAKYQLAGEVDKPGHPIIRRHVPDFLFHVPGQMDANLEVVEVKPVTTRLNGIGKDLRSLEYFLSGDVGYKAGVLLVYGGDGIGFERFKNAFADVRIQGAFFALAQRTWKTSSD